MESVYQTASRLRRFRTRCDSRIRLGLHQAGLGKHFTGPQVIQEQVANFVDKECKILIVVNKKAFKDYTPSIEGYKVITTTDEEIATNLKGFLDKIKQEH